MNPFSDTVPGEKKLAAGGWSQAIKRLGVYLEVSSSSRV